MRKPLEIDSEYDAVYRAIRRKVSLTYIWKNYFIKNEIAHVLRIITSNMGIASDKKSEFVCYLKIVNWLERVSNSCLLSPCEFLIQ